MMYYYGYGLGTGMGLVGLFLDVLWWGLVIWLIVAIVRALRHGNHYVGTKTPLDILKERYAKGEINKEEYEEKKKVLEL